MKYRLAVVLLAAACVSVNTRRASTVQLAPVSSDSVAVLYALPSRAYDVLGYLTASGGIGQTQGQYERGMRKAAAKLGARAVVVVGEDMIPIVGATPSVTKYALAIVWKESGPAK